MKSQHLFFVLILLLNYSRNCLAQQETDTPAKDPIPLPILQLSENHYILKGQILIQFGPGKIIEKEGEITIEDPLLQENLQTLGLLPLQMIPYQVKVKDKTLTLPDVYRVTIPVERDVPALCEALAKISGIQMAKPLYVNLKPKLPVLTGQGPNQLPPPYPVSNYPDFELWDFNPSSEKDFRKAFATLSLVTVSPGKWLIQLEEKNESNWILNQVIPEGEEDQIHLALLTPYEDHEVKIKTKIMARPEGIYKVGGIFYRFTNFENYYEIGLDYPEKKIKFYRIHKGIREPLMFGDAPLELGKWQTLEVVNDGPRCLVFLDSTPYISQSDDRIWHGKVGLWTKADTSLVFDDFSVEAIK